MVFTCLFVVVSVKMIGCFHVWLFFFFKQKTAYELRSSDWSSDVCSSDLRRSGGGRAVRADDAGDAEGAGAGDLSDPGRLRPGELGAALRRRDRTRVV